MDEKDFVSFETAKRLKEAGFNEICRSVWHFDVEKANFIEDYPATFHGYPNDFNNSDVFGLCIYSAPTLWQAQKWLREKKEINVLVGDCACGYYWEVSKAGDEQTRGTMLRTMLIYYDGNGEDECSGMWLSYEAALSAGIDEALNLIIKRKE